ncbi:OmpA family protein [Fulvivirga sp. M361]|uniref:OmpA family protein n=1 Tax=Fulvivirga sp. M361 TaxID=2594266 RepID=UPI00117A6CA6|nr:OmpA family protein [Fulvivirga sp. M361]TRX56191.1 OmpA family protein [Fulvivirga sp. M361]
MKTFISCLKKTLAIVCITLNSGFISGIQAQSLKDYYSYLVIGAFEFEENARSFAAYHKSEGLNTDIKKNDFNNLYYVFSFKSKDPEETRSEVFRIREKYNKLSDAWLYNGNFNSSHMASADFIEFVSPPKLAVAENVDNGGGASIEESREEIMKEQVVEKPKPTPRAMEEGVMPFYLNTVNASNSQPINGDIEFIDAERNKLITTYKAHESIGVKKPNNGTNRVTLITKIFGFKNTEITIDLDELGEESEGNVVQNGDSTIVNFNLIKYSKGDFATLWRVYFFIDAAIMKEESIYQLNQLLNMMKDNPTMKIRIHGHTNGNSHGEVMHLDIDDKNFFSLNGTHKKATASAKKLSLYRAYTIQHWLIDQGIAEERMEIQGWGGKKMLYDKHSSQADKNVRVEIEILEE